MDFPEFLTLLAFHLQETEPEEQLRLAFKAFDKDGNGKLNAEELKNTMTNLGERLSKEDVEYMIRMGDITGDGQINYEGDTSYEVCFISYFRSNIDITSIVSRKY